MKTSVRISVFEPRFEPLPLILSKNDLHSFSTFGSNPVLVRYCHDSGCTPLLTYGPVAVAFPRTVTPFASHCVVQMYLLLAPPNMFI